MFPQPPPFPSYDSSIESAALSRLKSNQWTRLEGSPELEKDFQTFLETDRSTWFVSSGTSALQAILLGYEIEPGDEVITTPLTWGATVSAILSIGAIPVFADVDRASGQISPTSVSNLIGPKTKAILAVHLYGTPAPVDILRKLADKEGIVLLEDASQAHGARLKGKRVGLFGHGAAFSCMGMKLLGGTEGGLALFEDEIAAERAFLYGKHPRGLRPDRIEALQADGLLDTLQLGWRPSAVSAEIIRARLPNLDQENESRRKNVEILRDYLNDASPLVLPSDPSETQPACHLLSFLVNDGYSLDEILHRSRSRKYPLFRYIPIPIHRMKRLNPWNYLGPPVFWHSFIRQHGINYDNVQCENAEWRAARSLEMSWNWVSPAPEAMKEIAEKLNLLSKVQ